MRIGRRLALVAALIPLLARGSLGAEAACADLDAAAALGGAIGAGIRAYAQGLGRASQAAAAAASVDLRGQFVDPVSVRQQSTIGACHAFSAIGALEAAYDRHYGRHIRLSEEDLFLRRTVVSGRVYGDFCSSGTCELDEGNYPQADIRHVLSHGVLTGSSYDSFLKRYLRYRAAEEQTMRGIQKARDEQGWLERLLYDPRAHWKALQTSASSKRSMRKFSDYLQGRSGDTAAERAKVKAEFKGFGLKTKSFPFIGGATAAALSDGACFAKGRAQSAAISSELAAGRPVVVRMSIAGLEAWDSDEDDEDPGRHAFLLVGYAGAAGARTFRSRNSWGGQDPDVAEDELCRVYGLVTVLAPGESATF